MQLEGNAVHVESAVPREVAVADEEDVGDLLPRSTWKATVEGWSWSRTDAVGEARDPVSPGESVEQDLLVAELRRVCVVAGQFDEERRIGRCRPRYGRDLVRAP